MPAVPLFRPTTGSWTQRPPRALSDDARTPTHVAPQPSNQPHTPPPLPGDSRTPAMSATLTPPQRGADPRPRSRRSLWWLLFVLCSLYAIFAASAAATELLNLAGFDIVAKT